MSSAYHVTVGVSDMQKSKKFYDAMFDLLDWSSHFEDTESKAYSSGEFDYWIAQAANKTERHQSDDLAVGINHLAIRVSTEEKVDELYAWLQSVDATIDIEPKVYPEYSEAYYAVFFYDPDGTRLEVVYNK